MKSSLKYALKNKNIHLLASLFWLAVIATLKLNTLKTFSFSPVTVREKTFYDYHYLSFFSLLLRWYNENIIDFWAFL